jgi:hypothetical protein
VRVQKRTTTVIQKQPTTHKSVDILLRCPRCGGRCRQLLRAGWCRTCAWVIRVERIAERKVRELTGTD